MLGASSSKEGMVVREHLRCIKLCSGVAPIISLHTDDLPRQLVPLSNNNLCISVSTITFSFPLRHPMNQKSFKANTPVTFTS